MVDTSAHLGPAATASTATSTTYMTYHDPPTAPHCTTVASLPAVVAHGSPLDDARERAWAVGPPAPAAALLLPKPEPCDAGTPGVAHTPGRTAVGNRGDGGAGGRVWAAAAGAAGNAAATVFTGQAAGADDCGRAMAAAGGAATVAVGTPQHARWQVREKRKRGSPAVPGTAAAEAAVGEAAAGTVNVSDPAAAAGRRRRGGGKA